MKSSSAAVTLSFLAAAASAQATDNYAQNTVKGPAFLNNDYNVQPGEGFPVRVQGCENECTITLKEGHAGNLQNTPFTCTHPDASMKKKTVKVKGDSGIINIPADAPNGKLALEITDNKGNVNYSPQFDFGGNGVSGNKPNAGDKPSSQPAAPSATESSASQSDRQTPGASSTARESSDSSAAPEATITSPASSSTKSSDSDDSTTVTPTPSASDSSSSSSDGSSSTSTSSSSRGSTRTSSSTTSSRTSTSTRPAGDSGVGHASVPWLLSGALAVLAYLN
ncbi:hypothetical protein CP533_0354 [Ophiocordyceps camponoti-saundersi (nom. inval.)]|nr:hypothetical protein CP533_0354 [Ophiocordyceps camponoti-saundersi (nom. inval.)]